MILFNNDYSEGAHESILALMQETNMAQTVGYGEDEYCERARKLIMKAAENENAYVQFLVGGTQANLIACAAMMRPWQGVISCDTGHVTAHEGGAIEATGHKVLTIPGVDGKLTAERVEAYYESYLRDPAREHLVQPKMVYISQSTEIGTVYSLAEIKALREVCDKYGLYLYLDGARLSYAIAASDVTIKDLAELCDMFYIGGTKCGALFGEAMVIMNDELKNDFRTLIKQRGAMLAKGRLLGIQFLGLFTDDLYFRIAKQAVDQAMRIRKAFNEKGVEMLIDSPTNQQFPILSDEQVKALSDDFMFQLWEYLPDGRKSYRFCTSWATDIQGVDKLVEAIAKL